MALLYFVIVLLPLLQEVASRQNAECKPFGLGMADGRITDSMIKVSSEQPGKEKTKARYGCCEDKYMEAWCPGKGDSKPYFEVHLNKSEVIEGLKFQHPSLGPHPTKYATAFIKNFRLLFKSAFSESGELQEFNHDIPAIYNESSAYHISFIPMFVTDFIRIEPQNWRESACFRMEIMSCNPKGLCPVDYCQHGGSCVGKNTCKCVGDHFGSRCNIQRTAVTVSTYTFLEIVGNLVKTTSHDLTLHGSVHIQTVQSHHILILGPNGYVEMRQTDQCLHKLDACLSGFTFSLTVSFTHLTPDTCHLVTSGADRPGYRGIALVYRQTHLYCFVSTSSQKWVINIPFKFVVRQWYRFQISWNMNLGLQLYENNKLIGSVVQPASTVSTKSHPLTVGYQTNTATMAVHEIQTVPLIHSETIRAQIHQNTLPPQLNEETTTVKTTPKVTTQEKPTELLTKTSPTVELSTATTVHTTTVHSTTTTTTEVESTTAEPCNGTPIKQDQFFIDLSFRDVTKTWAITNAMTLDVFGSPALRRKDNTTFLDMSSPGQYLQIDPNCLPCFSNLQNCTSGFTIQINVKFTSIIEENKTYIIHSGTETPVQAGISFFYQANHLKIVVQTGQDKWITSIPYTMIPNHLYKIFISWGHTFGLKVYVNQYLVGEVDKLHLSHIKAVKVFPILVGKGEHRTDTSHIIISNFHIWMGTMDVLISKGIVPEPLTTQPPTTVTTPVPTIPYSHREYHFNLKQATTSIITSSELSITVHGKPPFRKDGIHLTSNEHYLEIPHVKNTCLTNPDTCTEGITVAMEVRFTTLEENTVIFSTGAEGPGHPGLAMVYRFGQLHVICSTTTSTWYALLPNTAITTEAAQVFYISWSSSTTLNIYVDRVLVATAYEVVEHRATSTDLQGSFYFGKAVTVGWLPVKCVIKTLDIWYASVDILVHRGKLSIKALETSTPAPGTCPVGCVSEYPTKTPDSTKPSITEPVQTTGKPKPSSPSSTTSKPTTPKPTTPKPTTSKPATPKPTTPKPTTPKPTTSKPTTPKPIGVPPFEVRVTIRPDLVGTEAYFVCGVSGLAATRAVQLEFRWHIEGSRTAHSKQVVLPATEASLALTDIDADVHNKKVYCTAKAKYTVGTEWTTLKQSQIFIPGIYLVTNPRTKIQLIEGQSSKYIELKSNCPAQMFCGKDDNGHCKVKIVSSVSSRGDHVCTHGVVMPQVVFGSKVTGSENHICGSYLTSANWKLTIRIPVKATVDGLYERVTVRTISLKLEVTGEITRNTYFTDLTHNRQYQVQIINRDVKSTCSCVNDPHITSFDGVHYNNYLDGEYILYKHKTLPYEVRAHFTKCSRHRRNGATCNSAVAIRSGDDVITLKGAGGIFPSSRDHGHHGMFSRLFHHHRSHRRSVAAITVEMYKNGELTPGTTIRRIGCGQKYEIRLPTGTIVTVQASHSPFINIWVRASAVDYGQAVGLCGHFDGSKHNDFVGSNHVIYRYERYPNTFSNSWQMPVTLFYGVPAHSGAAVQSEVYCNCAQGTRVPYCAPGLDIFHCSTTPSRGDITQTIVRQAKRPILTSHRTKRAAVAPSVASPEVTNAPVSFTEEKAEQYCNDYILTSTAVSHCEDVLNTNNFSQSIQDCADDLVGTGEEGFARAHVENIIEQCVSEAVRNVSKWQGNETASISDRIPAAVVGNICIDNCGSHGKCKSGVCVCDEGYTGEVCDVNVRVPPQVIPVNPSGGACDIGSADCSQVALFGFDFVDSKQLTCHYEYIQVEEAVRLTGERGEVIAQYVSMYQVNCHLPRTQGAYISVSNDGVATSAERYLHVVHDAKCYNCDILDDGKQAKCSRQTDTCMIGGTCFQAGETRENKKCEICNPLEDETRWVKNPDPLCSAEKLSGADAIEGGINKTTTIALAVVCAVLATTLLVSAVVLCRRRLRPKKGKMMNYDLSPEATHPFQKRALAFNNDSFRSDDCQ